jgi:hypothetical protein
MNQLEKFKPKEFLAKSENSDRSDLKWYWREDTFPAEA